MPLTETALLDFISELGVRPGETVFVHANLALGLHVEGLSEAEIVSERLISTLGKVLGSAGTVCLPAFSYSWASGEIFNPLDAENFKQMGLLPQVAFREGFMRSSDPLFSVLLSGPGASQLIPKSQRSFGPGSTFSSLIECNSRVISIGLDVGSTLIHEVEYRNRVPYRSLKSFSGVTQLESGSQRKGSWLSYVRDLDDTSTVPDFSKLHAAAIGRTPLKTAKLGRRSSYSYKIQDMAALIAEILPEVPDLLISGSDDL